MAEKINTLNAKNEIQAQLDGFNVQLLSNLPSLEWENLVGDRARDIMFLLGLGKNFNPSGYIEALRQERMKVANNLNYNSAQEKSS